MLTLKDFLAKEVRPALGCTDPGAVALAVARACKELPEREEVASVRVTVSGSIYKNGRVGISACFKRILPDFMSCETR